MSRSKWIRWAAVFLCALVVGSTVCTLCFDPVINKYGLLTTIRLRSREICCSHEGVNPFHVWARNVESDKYTGIPRPDKPPIEADAGKETVHAYPPWHTVFFWWLGYLPVWGVVLTFLGGCALSLWGLLAYAHERMQGGDMILQFSLLACISMPYLAGAMSYGNYGLVIAALLLLLFRALDKGHDVLAGIVWAVMMIKPQIGVLLFWPLLFQRKWCTIASAIGICTGATCLMSIWYKESPLVLLMQIPEIGRPYLLNGELGLVQKIAVKLLGEFGVSATVGVGFVCCAVMSYLLKNSRNRCIQFAPALLIFPFWTYSANHDQSVLFLLNLEAVVFGCCAMGGWSREKLICGKCLSAMAVASAFCWGWASLCALRIFDPTGWGWIYQLLDLGRFPLLFAVVFLCRKAEKSAVPAE